MWKGIGNDFCFESWSLMHADTRPFVYGRAKNAAVLRTMLLIHRNWTNSSFLPVLQLGKPLHCLWIEGSGGNHSKGHVATPLRLEKYGADRPGK